MKNLIYIFLFLSLSAQAQLLGVLSANQPVVDSGTPVLSSFEITDAEPARVYFDASGDVTGLTTSGFVISNKTISTVTIDGDGLGGYFTVSSGFTFWDNSTIRLESGDGTVHDFNLTYIENSINEPAAMADRYVTVTGAGSHNGTIGNEWTITEAFTNAVAGQTVHIAAGDYGSVNCTVANDGTATDPIKFIGYDSAPGDNPSLTRSVGMAFDSNVMPLLDGSAGTGINTGAENYIIIKNIQIKNYSSYQIYSQGSDYVVFDNVYVEGTSAGMGIRSRNTVDKNQRVINSYVANCYQQGITIWGSNHLIRNTWVVSSKNVGGGGMDYYISVLGGRDRDNGNNIVKDNYIERSTLDTGHTGHGISIEALDPPYFHQYNLIDGNEIVNTRQSLEARHQGVRYSHYVDNIVYGAVGAPDDEAGGIKITNGANNNVFDRNRIYHAKYAIGFGASGEDQTAPDGGNNNLIANGLFYDNQAAISVDEDAYAERGISSNSIEFSTFYNNDVMWSTGSNDISADSNDINNCLIVNSGNDNVNGNEHGWDQNNSNYYNNISFTVPTGTNILQVNPNFVDTIDFVPQNSALAGVSVSGLEYDKNKKERNNPPTMGAVEID